jgi:uncharacterized protein YbjT (DUF2867 family)
MSETQNKPILVLGGTGNLGRFIVHSLLEKGALVRVLSRNASKARMILGDDPEIVEGDITSSDSVIKALKGVSAVVLSISAITPKLIRKLKLIERDAVLKVLEKAEKAGITRIVYVSIYDIRIELPGDFDFELRRDIARAKLNVENALAASEFNWTVLGAPPSMEIFFRMIRGNTMAVPGGGPPALPTISPRDVGEIAALSVLRNDLNGRRFRLVGPEAISFPEAAERIGLVIGKTIKYRKIPLLFPKIARIISLPFTPFSDLILFINQMLGFIQILNQFPRDLVEELPRDHCLLLNIFDYIPTTLEMEAQRWIEG